MGLTFAFIMTSGETLMFIEPYPNPDSPRRQTRPPSSHPPLESRRVASVGSVIPHLIFEYLRQLSETPPPGWPGSYPGYPSRNGVLAKMAVSYQLRPFGQTCRAWRDIYTRWLFESISSGDLGTRDRDSSYGLNPRPPRTPRNLLWKRARPSAR